MLAATLCFLAACAQYADFNQGVSESLLEVVEIPFEIIGESHMVIEAELDGEKLRLLLDTGAPLMLSPEIIERHHMPLLHKSTLTDSSGKVVASRVVRSGDLRLGKFVMHGAPAFEYDTHQAMNWFSCFDVDGLVGSNIFRDVVLQIDSNKQVIRIAPSSSALELKVGDAVAMQLDYTHSRQSLPLVQFEVNGRPLTTLIDSGSDGFFDISQKDLQRLREEGVIDDKAVKGYWQGDGDMGLHGDDENRLDDKPTSFTVEKMSLGEWSLSGITLTSDTGFKTKIGNDFLHQGLVTFDFPKGLFFFQAYKDAGFPKREYSFGFGMGLKAGKPFVNTIAPFLLGEIDLRQGDIILSLNGHYPADFSFCEAFLQLRNWREQSDLLDLEIERDGRRHSLQLRRREF